MDRLAALPPDVPSEQAAELAIHMRRVLDRATRWYVTHDHRDQPIATALARIMPTLDLLRTRTSDYLRGSDIDRVQERPGALGQRRAAADLAVRASDLLESFGLLDISLVSEQVHEPITTIADLYYAVFQRIDAAGPAPAHHGPAAPKPLGNPRPGSPAGRCLFGRGRHDRLGDADDDAADAEGADAGGTRSWRGNADTRSNWHGSRTRSPK